MRRLVWLAGIASIALAVPGSGLAATGSLSSSRVPSATVSVVTRAFAARGIPLELKDKLMAARGTNGLPKVFWNRKVASSQGVITVQVLRTVADVRSLPSRMLKTDTCAGFPTSYLTVKSRNVVATYTSCVTLNATIHLATSPVLDEFVAAMQSLR